MGGRLRYTNTNKALTIRALVDVWVPPSTFSNDPLKNPAGHVTPKLDTYLRVDVQTTHDLRLGLWERYQDKDLEEGGHDQCFEVTTDTSLTGEPVPCFGRQLTTIARATYRPDATLSGELEMKTSGGSGIKFFSSLIFSGTSTTAWTSENTS